MAWFRIDNRLIHGQVIETWLPYLGATNMIVCNVEMANDPLRQQIALLAVPSRIAVSFTDPSKLQQQLEKTQQKGKKTLVLFSNAKDVQQIFHAGVAIPTLNIGNMHYAAGKKQVCTHIALSGEESTILQELRRAGVELDFRCVPNDTTEIMDWQL